MNLSKPVGSLQNINGASVYVADLELFRHEGAVIPAWSSVSHVRPLISMQEAAIRLHGEFTEQMRRVVENADLTREAKKRQTTDYVTTFLAGIETDLPRLNEAAAAALSVAGRQLLPAAPLTQADAVQATLDVEARAFLRSMGKQDRDAFMLQMSRGQHPEITSSVLRGPAILSGLDPRAHANLAAAGIANNHETAVRQLAMYAGSLRDLLWMSSTLAKNLLGKAVEPGSSLAGRIENWHAATPAINELITWLKPIPVDLPDEEPEGEVAA